MPEVPELKVIRPLTRGEIAAAQAANTVKRVMTRMLPIVEAMAQMDNEWCPDCNHHRGAESRSCVVMDARAIVEEVRDGE